MDHIPASSPAFVALGLQRLIRTIEDQGDALLRARGIRAPSRLCSVLLTIGADAPCSAAHVARRLDISHQLVTQRIGALAKIGWVRQQPDPNDGRASNWVLTNAGRRNRPRIAEAVMAAERAFVDLYREIGVDLAAQIAQANDALIARSIASRARAAEEADELAAADG